MNLFRLVKEDLYKFFLSLIIFGFIFCSYNSNNNIYNDIITIDTPKSTIGICLFNNDKVQNSILYQNWISNNLFLATSIQPIKNNSDLSLGYNIQIGYKVDYNRKKFKNLIMSIGYNRLRFDNFENNVQALNLDLISTVKFQNIFMILSFGISDSKNYYNKLLIEFMKKITDKLFLKVGTSIKSFSNEDLLSIPFITLKYAI